MSAFEDAVVRWLTSEGKPAKAVKSIDPYGSDWEGDTLTGFTSAFNVTIQYETYTGTMHRELVEGDALERLWRFMMDAAFNDTPS